MEKIGEESSEVLHHIPARIIIQKHIRNKYACKCCDSVVKTAPKVAKPLLRSGASSSMLSHILTAKYCDYLPFYRQEQIFKSRYELRLSRKLMSNWLFKSAKLFMPLMSVLKEELLSCNYISCDETPVRMLSKDNGGKSYMWVYKSMSKKKPLIYFNSCLDRRMEHAELFLNNYEGYVQSDGYSGYNFLTEKNNITRLGCMAHARRKFYDIAKLLKESKAESISSKVLNMIRELYLIEKEARNDKLDDKSIVLLRKKEKQRSNWKILRII